MDKWDNKPSRKQHQRENPSFSSTLLDVIYRSIDEGTQEEKEEEQLIFYRETMRKQKQSNSEAEKANSRRARKVENWMEKGASEKVLMGRNSLTEFERRTRSNSISNTLSMYSSSTSSSESSSVGGFSSSESESFYGVQRPKPIKISPIKTSFDASLHNHNCRSHSSQNQKPKHENGFGKTKSKALKILYGELKKAKQPISPGARLASFINSLFTSSGNAKKGKVSTTSTFRPAVIPVATDRAADAKSAAQPGSTCSSASSFSRSCLSKTPSSRSGAKRSVRFCPVSVIVDEDCRPCGHKNLHEGEEGLVASNGKNRSEELRLHVMQESRRVEELARDLLKNYQKKSEVEFDDVMHYEDEVEDDDDDVASCSSSDLFELDNLSAIGIERYREELPVYETTHFNTNRAIANGFILVQYH
ncbi:Protein BIG GRAIN 1-like A, partial [Mucuna pruriens]